MRLVHSATLRSELGHHRWVVHSLGWLHQMKRLRVREERSAEMHHPALLRLGCCLILYRELERHLRDGL